MRVITKRVLRDFWDRYSDAKQALLAWHAEAEAATWRTPAEVKAMYGSASIVPGNRVVFNICGNKYRLVVKVHYNTGFVYVRFIDTHAEYDKIDATTV